MRWKAPVALVLLLAAQPARAAEPEVAEPEVAELEYARPELGGCPEEAAFRRAVIDRLGRDPFELGAARRIRVSFTQTGTKLTAVVRVQEVGQAPGERRIETRAGCEELASGAALAVSIAIDPLVAMGHAQVEPTQAAPAPAEPSKKPALVAEPSARVPSRNSERATPQLFVRAGVSAWAGAVPELSTGPSLGLSYQRGFGSLALDALAVLPRSERVAGTSRAASVGVLGGRLSTCAHAAGFRSCAVVTPGAVFARGQGVDQPRSGRAWSLAAGIAVGYSLFVGRFSLTPNAEASVRFVRTQLFLEDQLLWATPRVLGSLGLEIAYDVLR